MIFSTNHVKMMYLMKGFEYKYSGDFWISLFPGIALLITVASINLVGDHLRDMFNPRLH